MCIFNEKLNYTSLQNNIITGNCNTLKFLHHLSCTFNRQYPLFILPILLVTSHTILHGSSIKYIKSHYSSLLSIMVHIIHLNVLKLKLGSYLPHLKVLYMLPSHNTSHLTITFIAHWTSAQAKFPRVTVAKNSLHGRQRIVFKKFFQTVGTLCKCRSQIKIIILLLLYILSLNFNLSPTHTIHRSSSFIPRISASTEVP